MAHPAGIWDVAAFLFFIFCRVRLKKSGPVKTFASPVNKFMADPSFS
jgi:hypothetical protein